MLFAEENLCYADILSPLEVRARIEIAVINFLKLLSSPSPAVSDLPLVIRKTSNSRARQGFLTGISWVYLSDSFCKRSLMRPNAAKAFIRVWKVMEMCLKILVEEKRVTQRELFYKLLCDSPDYFTDQLQVNRTIQDVVALLRCSRYSLGIMASSRGIVVGRLLIQEPGKEVLDCTACGSSGYAISGDLNLIENLVINTDARYIIVVEKHAIFQRLAEDRVFNQIPTILITAKGYPDLATRLLLHKLSRAFPELPILALVDWNPAGLAILCTFKYGSAGMGLEAYRYGDQCIFSIALSYSTLRPDTITNFFGCFNEFGVPVDISACNVKWLGLRADDLHLLPEESFLPLKQRDLQIARSLTSSAILQENYRDELALMVERGVRAEIEALYFHGYDYLGKYIAKKIVQANYI